MSREQIQNIIRPLFERREMGGQGQREHLQGLQVDTHRNETVYGAACFGALRVERLLDSDIREVKRFWKATEGKVQKVAIRTLKGYTILSKGARCETGATVDMMEALVCGACQTWRHPPSRIITLDLKSGRQSFRVCALCGDCIACGLDIVDFVRSFANFSGIRDLSSTDRKKLSALCNRYIVFFSEERNRLACSKSGEYDVNNLYLYTECVSTDIDDRNQIKRMKPITDFSMLRINVDVKISAKINRKETTNPGTIAVKLLDAYNNAKVLILNLKRIGSFPYQSGQTITVLVRPVKKSSGIILIQSSIDLNIAETPAEDCDPFGDENDPEDSDCDASDNVREGPHATFDGESEIMADKSGPPVRRSPVDDAPISENSGNEAILPEQRRRVRRVVADSEDSE